MTIERLSYNVRGGGGKVDVKTLLAVIPRRPGLDRTVRNSVFRTVGLTGEVSHAPRAVGLQTP